MSPILGLGTDIIKISRIKKAYKEHSQAFLDRLFTKKEQAYCQTYKDPFPHYAGRFAAKEALVKTLGCGFGEIAGYQDIEILALASGQPEVTLSFKLKKHFNNPLLLVTISHSEEFAIAVALWMRSPEEPAFKKES